MAQVTQSLCEEIIRTNGKVGLTEWEKQQLAALALKSFALPEAGVALDAARYRWLRENSAFEKYGIFVGRQHANGVGRWFCEAADALIDGGMAEDKPGPQSGSER